MARARTAQSEMAFIGSSGKTNWSTPDDEAELVRRVDARARGVAEGVIGLDPCCNPFAEKIIRPRVACMLERGENGLARSWRGHGMTWCNPPYGVGEVDLFTAKAARDFGGELRAPLGDDQALLVVPANCETRWYHRDLAGQADATCLREGRIAFIDPETGKPSKESTVRNLFAYFGDRPDVFLDVYGDQGDARLTPIGARRLRSRGFDKLVLRIVCGLIA